MIGPRRDSPNIVTIYDIGEHEGTPHIAMEYVKGRTLRDFCASGPLPGNVLVRCAKQLVEVWPKRLRPASCTAT